MNEVQTDKQRVSQANRAPRTAAEVAAAHQQIAQQARQRRKAYELGMLVANQTLHDRMMGGDDDTKEAWRTGFAAFVLENCRRLLTSQQLPTVVVEARVRLRMRLALLLQGRVRVQVPLVAEGIDVQIRLSQAGALLIVGDHTLRLDSPSKPVEPRVTSDQVVAQQTAAPV